MCSKNIVTLKNFDDCTSCMTSSPKAQVPAIAHNDVQALCEYYSSEYYGGIQVNITGVALWP